MKNKKFFSDGLLSWNETQNSRQMPWKGESDPYKIWISEIILQQTRVQHGMAYYNRFITAFPNVKALAIASEREVYKLWEGLGYYSRCKNLIATAQFIDKDLGGKFPEKYEDILALKGIGKYTAAAIASFAYNQPYAVLDGNVFRVLSRFFGEEIPINTTKGKKFYGELSTELLDKKNPAKYNQALMDFGAVICKPSSPLCLQCPLQLKCIAFLKDKVSFLPVNNKTIKQKRRFFNYLVVSFDEKFYVHKRIEKDIWQNLYEFILIETKKWESEKEIIVNQQFLKIFNLQKFEVAAISEKFFQKLTHQYITGRFIHIQIETPLNNREYQAISYEELLALPLPKFIASYLREKMYL